MKWLSEIMRLLYFINWENINWVHKKSHTVASPALAFWYTNIWGKKNTLKEENIIPRREEHGVMQTNSTNSELGRRYKKGGKIGKDEFLEQHLLQAQNKSEKLHPEKFGLVHPLQRAQISNFILQMKVKDLTWKKFNFWGQILSPPHWGQLVPVLGLWLKEWTNTRRSFAPSPKDFQICWDTAPGR